MFDVKLQCSRSCKFSPRQVYDFKKANLKDLNELFHWIPWNCAFLEDDVNSPAVNVTDLCLAAADDCIPKFVVKKKLIVIIENGNREFIVKIHLATTKACFHRRYRSRGL